MAQYTKCATYGEFLKHKKNWPSKQDSPLIEQLSNSINEGLKLGGMVGGICALLGTIGGPLGVLIAGLVGAYYGFSFGFIKGFCDEWLFWRLLCIKDDQCAIGSVVWIEPPEDKLLEDPVEWLYDNDLSFNVRLIPYSPAEFPYKGGAKYGLDSIDKDMLPAADLIKKPDGWNQVHYHGYEGDTYPDNPGGRWTLHCEIEGSGMYTLCNIARAINMWAPVLVAVGALAGAVVGAAYAAVQAYNAVRKACKGFCKIPILCDIVCFVAAAAAAAVAAVAGFFVGGALGVLPGLSTILMAALLGLLFRDNGNWEDVVDPESGTIHKGDWVAVFGNLVYDAGHSDGWSELHPVKRLYKISEQLPPTYFTPGTGPTAQFSDAIKKEVDDYWSKWCDAIREGHRPDVAKSQLREENSWFVHPMIDGCQSDLR